LFPFNPRRSLPLLASQVVTMAELLVKDPEVWWNLSLAMPFEALAKTPRRFNL
jgi:hypothetical protein